MQGYAMSRLIYKEHINEADKYSKFTNVANKVKNKKETYYK